MENGQNFKHLPYFNKLNKKKPDTETYDTTTIIDRECNQLDDNQNTPNQLEMAPGAVIKRALELIKEGQKLINELGQPDFVQTRVDTFETTDFEGNPVEEIRIYVTVYNEELWDKLVDGKMCNVNMPTTCVDLEIKERYLVVEPISLLRSSEGIKMFLALGLMDKISKAKEKPVNLYFNHASLRFVKFAFEDYIPVYINLE